MSPKRPTYIDPTVVSIECAVHPLLCFSIHSAEILRCHSVRACAMWGWATCFMGGISRLAQEGEQGRVDEAGKMALGAWIDRREVVVSGRQSVNGSGGDPSRNTLARRECSLARNDRPVLRFRCHQFSAWRHSASNCQSTLFCAEIRALAAGQDSPHRECPALSLDSRPE